MVHLIPDCLSPAEPGALCACERDHGNVAHPNERWRRPDDDQQHLQRQPPHDQGHAGLGMRPRRD
jgi:hypothetical protein